MGPRAGQANQSTRGKLWVITAFATVALLVDPKALIMRFQCFPFLWEVVTLNFYAMFDGHVAPFPFQCGCRELHVLVLFKKIIRHFDIIEKRPDIDNNCPCYATAHLRICRKGGSEFAGS